MTDVPAATAARPVADTTVAAARPVADTEVAAACVQAVLRQTPLAVLVSVAIAALIVAATDAEASGPREVVWLAAVLAVGLLRLALWRAHRADPCPEHRPGRWSMAAAGGAAAAGLLWGGGAAWLWPDSAVQQLFWVFAVGGMCTGAVAVSYAHLPTALAFILPAALPIAARFALEGTHHGLGAAAMIAVFLCALAATAQRASAHFGGYVRLRLDAASRASALDAANARLQREMEERLAAEADLRQAQKMEAIGQLTGGVAHDFNNLLTAVLGSLALLRRRLPREDRRAARLLETAVEGANRGAVLTQRLLAFARRQTLNPRPVDLPGLVGGMADLLGRSIGPRHALRANFPEGLAPAHVDPHQLELALLNLVVNARDAMPEGGTIEISAMERDVGPADGPDLTPGPYVILTVVDDGIGMDAATLARAAEPFFTTKGVGRGTGLGLPMAHGLASQSGGRLVLRSVLGRGTEVELWLPRAEALAAPQPAAKEPGRGGTTAGGAPLHALSVLMVDDDPLVLASTAALIEDLGHGVIEAEGGPQALAWVRAGTAFDLVITDYGMPGMTGLELAAELKQLRPGLPVLLATGYGDVPALEASSIPRLAKPFGQAALAAAIEATMGRVESSGAPV